MVHQNISNNNNQMSVEELVHSYNSKQISKININIYIGKDRTNNYTINSILKTKDEETIVYDPDRISTLGTYFGSYYCNTLRELKQLVEYLISESLQKTFESEDILDSEQTKRYTLEKLDEIECKE
ncbi:MAG: hypothetical protein J6T10_05345 [Methanobrevibacter sp.]|nr:hypothetical protein [Methanobrevibacter sp.]